MKSSTAINRLTKAGYTVSEDVAGEGTLLHAVKGGAAISFISSHTDTVRSDGFTYTSSTSCAPTHGMTLKGAMA